MSYAFLDIRIGNSPSNRVVIQLFEDDAPKTGKFFKSLLSHENGYKGTRFQRVIEEFMIQGGDVAVEDDASIPSGPATMENVERAVNKPGLVGLARKSVAEFNAQFFITLGNAEHLRGVHTIFGQVVKGMEFVKKISEVDVDDDDVPVAGSEVTIVNCGELQQRGNRQPPPQKSVSPERKWRRPQDEENKEELREDEPSRRDTDSYIPRDRSPPRRDEDRRKRSRTPDSDSDTQRRHRHHHHHHHHRRHRKSVNEGDRNEKNGHSIAAKPRERSRSPQRRKQDPPNTSQSRDTESTGRREYIPRRQERRESNYGRLGFVSGYDDETRDDEYHLRDVERRREEDRENVEPAVKFKGRGAMKFLENRRREYRY
jgi:cyclophilin family peptidyl-prolyl cis-trans isomerase